MEDKYLSLLKKQFNNRISFKEKRPGIAQLIAPFYYEDGDMLDVYYEHMSDNGSIRISDYGMTLMHLSYNYDVDSQNKERIFKKILSENGLKEHDGSIYIDVSPSQLYQATLQFTQAISKISSMRYFGREAVLSMFYEMLEEFVCSELAKYNPIEKVQPLAERDDLEVDFALETGKKPIYLFGVKSVAKARLTTICCLEFQNAKLPFRSIVIHEDYDTLPRKDRARLTSAADKQFIDLDDFKKNGEMFIEREIA